MKVLSKIEIQHCVCEWGGGARMCVRVMRERFQDMTIRDNDKTSYQKIQVKCLCFAFICALSRGTFDL